MAKRTRARTVARAPDKRAPKRAAKTAKTILIEEPVTADEEGAAPVRLDGRCLSRRIEFTGRLIAHIRERYERAGDGPDVIARSVGVAKATIQRLVREQGWTRAPRGPCDLSRAEQLAAEARALAAETVDGAAAAPPVDIDLEIERLLRLVSAEIGVYENLRATLMNEPQAQREAQKTTHNLSVLTSTLDTLRRMRAGQTAMGSHDDYDDDIPADIDALRDALARRIEAFMASRPDDEDACGPDPARADGA